MILLDIILTFYSSLINGYLKFLSGLEKLSEITKNYPPLKSVNLIMIRVLLS